MTLARLVSKLMPGYVRDLPQVGSSALDEYVLGLPDEWQAQARALAVELRARQSGGCGARRGGLRRAGWPRIR